jgi:3-deoxy-D-manno-octulosonate 8-phosphate phosphatase (KDO 8-P phosphatase)
MFKAFQQITTFVFDVDGVMTDGAVLVMPNGLMARAMNIKDGYALQLAIKRGYKVLVISGGDSPEVKERLAKLGVTQVWMKAHHKKQILDQYLSEHNIPATEILYMGDDIPDLEVMRSVGLPCCPADAATEIREAAQYISPLNGGKGCVRDVIEKVLKLNGHWGEDSSVPSR